MVGMLYNALWGSFIHYWLISPTTALCNATIAATTTTIVTTSTTTATATTFNNFKIIPARITA